MIDKRKCIAALFVFLFSAFCAYAENDKPVSPSGEPVEINADRMEAFNKEKLVVFSGNAVVTRGNAVLKADKLLLYYKDGNDENDKTDKKITEEISKGGELEKIEAKGNVCLTQDERVATGDEAVYYREENKIVVTGNALLNEGKNSIKGDKVTIFLNENKGIVEGDTQKRIKAIIYPQTGEKTAIK
jgi:lipopolysaccharide export system protein LptA